MNVARILPVFSVAFVVLYTIAMYFNIALFVYYPQVNQFHWHDQPGLPGPAMYWYGWLATAAIAAAVVSGLGSVFPVPRLSRASGLVWAVPCVAALFILYILRPWFLH
jgi:hypothetical protein